MNTEQAGRHITTFSFEGTSQPVSFVETTQVTDGVECDIYAFEGDNTKDLGIIRIEPWFKTPLQRVLKGDKTVEGYISGKGKLVLTTQEGIETQHAVGESPNPFSVSIEIGETMQWQAADDSPLVAYEICFPPYQDGRFQNL